VFTEIIVQLVKAQAKEMIDGVLMLITEEAE
jgi:hypothetical protein